MKLRVMKFEQVAFVFSLISMMIYFSGCTRSMSGLSVNESKEYPLVMVANSDILCKPALSVNFLIQKNTKFGVHDIAKAKYGEGQSLQKEEVPEHTLFLEFEKGNKIGFFVYPNGAFTFEDGGVFLARYTFDGELYFLNDGTICTFDAKKPFTPRRITQ